MRESEGRTGRFPPCGYGSMGLCCSSCLLGPCRISPFEGNSAKEPCGDNADLMVAKNLLRLVGLEAVSGLKDLSETIRRLGSSASQQPAGKGSARGELKGIVEKYGLGVGVSPKRLSHYLVRESQRLLSPPSEVERPSSLLASLYPERAFPHIHRMRLLPRSLTDTLFEALSRERMESLRVEGILWQCLKTSMLKIISEELRRDMSFLTNRGRPPEAGKEALDGLGGLSPNPLPVIVIFSRDEDPQRELMNRTARELQQGLKGDVLYVPITHIATLPEIGRRFFQKWSLSTAEGEVIFVAFSPSAASVLGALVCGFTALSYPALPIYGSAAVEEFLGKGLKEKFGSVYVPPREGEIVPAILGLLRGRA